ncbi:MAG TPA: type II secretion system F family protein [Verrucomicrobia bacterium]|nr:type II secretion system F family protein [Verrucomicrobiota bacterium]HOP95895.1 type II secretion system F family protein [Verrucomicrobiota bacterium]HPU54917.1 type II secretion system F family protein [Verrucomicrobiota bacterium]
MASFVFVARDTVTGREIRSSVEAVTEQAAIAALLNRNLLVVNIQEKVGKKGRTGGGKVALHDLVIFTRQLATMIDAGLAMVQSLQALAEQATNKAARDVIRDISARVEAGDSFSEALQKHPKVFNRLYIAMVSAGEKGGLLAEILARLATYLENTARLRKKVKSAMMYPSVVTIVAIAITTFLLVKVVPVFGDIYSGFGAKLPGPTLFLIELSNMVKKYLLLLLLAGGGAVYGWLYFIKTKPGRQFWDSRRIKLPVFGTIAHKICLARFTRTLASLVRSGVPILEVLQIVSQTVGNVVMEKAVKDAAGDIERGESISTALAKHSVFPSMVIRMITAGEQTGKIDEMLERISNFLDEEIETTLSGLTSLIEPILIVFLGVVIGGMVICMFLPIFKMSEIVNPQR